MTRAAALWFSAPPRRYFRLCEKRYLVFFPLPLRRNKILIDRVPVGHFPPRRQIIRAPVLIFQIVGVLPHIHAHHGLPAPHPPPSRLPPPQSADYPDSAATQSPACHPYPQARPAGAEPRHARR